MQRRNDGSGNLNELKSQQFRIIAHPTSNISVESLLLSSELNKCEQSSLSNFDASLGNLAASR